MYAWPELIGCRPGYCRKHPMKTLINETKPVAHFSYNNIVPFNRQRGRNSILEVAQLPLCNGYISGVQAPEIDYLILASDLQGTVVGGGRTMLLGEVLPEFLQLILELDYDHTDLNRVGILRCGDLFARTDRRGGLRDVKHIWRGFNEYFRFVVGVAGNHDDFGQPEERAVFTQEEGIHLLHGEVAEIAGIQFGGISGVIGRPS